MKKVRLKIDNDKELVKEKITSDAKDSDGIPSLKTCGGFELMHCAQNYRDLTQMDCSWSAKNLQFSLSVGQGKIYSVQKSLSTRSILETRVANLKEKCLFYKKQFPIRELRKHLCECEFQFESDDDLVLSPAFGSVRDQISTPPGQMQLANITGSEINPMANTFMSFIENGRTTICPIFTGDLLTIHSP